jgi:hypothetical protein
MCKLAVAALAAASLVGATAPSASAADGPCATQRALFEKYNIQTDMDAPAVAWAYNTACAHTG